MGKTPFWSGDDGMIAEGLASVCESAEDRKTIFIPEETGMSKRVIRDVIEGRPLITAKKEMTVRAACQEMAARKIGALLIVDRRKIQGIFTERDALVKVLAAGLDPETTLLSQVMVTEPLTIRDARPLSHALHMMAEGGFRHVPVTDDDGHPVGMVSARDALGEDLVDLERELARRDELESSIGY